MRVLLFPLVSQYDRVNKVLDATRCCVSKINGFLAQKFLESENEVTIFLPMGTVFNEDTVPTGVEILFYDVGPSNIAQRLHQDYYQFRDIFGGRDFDLIISHHELKTPFLRHIFPRTNIVQFNHLMPFGENQWMLESQKASWYSANAVVFLNNYLASRAKLLSYSDCFMKDLVWPMCYSETLASYQLGEHQGLERDIDLLFVQRCSESNYTHHREFFSAIEILRGRGWKGKAMMTDPTGWAEIHMKGVLEKYQIDLANASSTEEYWKILARSKYAIALMKDDLHGGIAIREAIRAGCIPLLLDTSGYDNILSPGSLVFPSRLKIKKHTMVEDIVDHMTDPPNETGLHLLMRSQSFESSWNTVVTDLAKMNLLVYR